MSRSAERVKNPGPLFVGDNDGDSPAPLATAATVRAFPRWPATSITTRRDAQVRKPDGVYSLPYSQETSFQHNPTCPHIETTREAKEMKTPKYTKKIQ